MKRRKGAVASVVLRAPTGSAPIVAIAFLSGPWVMGCSDHADDCTYNLTCPTNALGGSNAGTGGKQSGGNQSGGKQNSTGGIGGNAGTSVAGGATAINTAHTATGGTTPGGTNATGIGGNATGGIMVSGTGGTTSPATGGIGTGGIISACNPSCSGTKPVCNESAASCVECMGDGNCSGTKPACNGATNTCVECVNAGNCSGSTPACNSATNRCVPCISDGNCPPATPACDTSTNTCIRCTKNDHCSRPTPVCDTAEHACVECLSDINCSGAKPACKTATVAAPDAGTATIPPLNTCVQCTSHDDCTGTKSLCDESTNLCVECLTNHDCPSVSASLCIAGTCSPCAANADCSHIAGKTVCDTTRTSEPDADAGTIDAGTGEQAGTCVQCTGTDYSTCGQLSGKNLVCDSLTDTCSTTQTQHSAGLCQTCISDAQCAAGELCAEQIFNGKRVGHFCFYKQGDTANGAPASCLVNGQPYVKVFNTTSIDGQTADLCALRSTTCTALNEFSSTLCKGTTGTADDTLCGFEPAVDSKCSATTAAGVYLCTTTCGSNLDCRTGFNCNIGTNPPVCNLQ